MFTVQDKNIICKVLKYALILISVHLIEKRSCDRRKTKIPKHIHSLLLSLSRSLSPYTYTHTHIYSDNVLKPLKVPEEINACVGLTLSNSLSGNTGQ